MVDKDQENTIIKNIKTMSKPKEKSAFTNLVELNKIVEKTFDNVLGISDELDEKINTAKDKIESEISKIVNTISEHAVMLFVDKLAEKGNPFDNGEIQ